MRCDTEFTSGQAYTNDELLAAIKAASPVCRWIIWTGGEPTDQLKTTDVEFFKAQGYQQAIETSGIRPLPIGLDWVTVSPKVAEHVLTRNFIGQHVNELKYVRLAGHSIPEPSLTADYYFLQPHALGQFAEAASLQRCLDLCKAHPQWSLSLQTHKLLGVR